MDEIKKTSFGSLQPDVEDILNWNDFSDDDFKSASAEEKKDFIPQRASVSYWADAWRRLKKNTVAMIALFWLSSLFLLLSVLCWFPMDTSNLIKVQKIFILGIYLWKIRHVWRKP